MKKLVFLLIGPIFIVTMAFAQGDEAPAMPLTPPTMPGEVVPVAPPVPEAVVVPEAPMAPIAPVEETITITGDIIDNMCADANKEKLADFVKTHTKECAIMPMCAASGYSIYLNDGSIMKFDTESAVKIEGFLKNEDNQLKVVVEAKKTSDMLSLISIKNQE